MKGNVNKTGFEILDLFEHQALWQPSLVHDKCVSSVSCCASRLLKLARKEDIDEISQKMLLVLAPESIKEMVKTPSMFLPSESPGSSEAPLLLQAQRPVKTHTTVSQHSLNTGSACL